MLGPLLRLVRDSKGLTLAQVAARVGTSATQLSRLENEGHGAKGRRVSTYWLNRILPIYEITFEELLRFSTENTNTVPVVGVITEGETLFLGDGDLGRVAPPPGTEGTHAIQIRTDALWPRFQPGDTVFFRPASTIAPECIGRDCVIQTAGGRVYIRRILNGSKPGRYRLASYHAPDIEDVEVLWASCVVWIKPGAS